MPGGRWRGRGRACACACAEARLGPPPRPHVRGQAEDGVQLCAVQLCAPTGAGCRVAGVSIIVTVSIIVRVSISTSISIIASIGVRSVMVLMLLRLLRLRSGAEHRGRGGGHGRPVGGARAGAFRVDSLGAFRMGRMQARCWAAGWTLDPAGPCPARAASPGAASRCVVSHIASHLHHTACPPPRGDSPGGPGCSRRAERARVSDTATRDALITPRPSRRLCSARWLFRPACARRWLACLGRGRRSGGPTSARRRERERAWTHHPDGGVPLPLRPSGDGRRRIAGERRGGCHSLQDIRLVLGYSVLTLLCPRNALPSHAVLAPGQLRECSSVSYLSCAYG